MRKTNSNSVKKLTSKTLWEKFKHHLTCLEKIIELGQGVSVCQLISHSNCCYSQVRNKKNIYIYGVGVKKADLFAVFFFLFSVSFFAKWDLLYSFFNYLNMSLCLPK